MATYFETSPQSNPQNVKGPSNPVHVINVPQAVQIVLSIGPKFAVEPKRSPQDMLLFIRQVSRRAPELEVDRVTSEGVDLLLPQVPQASSLSTGSVIKYLQEHSLFILPAKKEGGFAVMHQDMFGTKAISVIKSVFQCHEDVSLSKAKKIC